MLKPSEFRTRMESCIRDAQAQGLPIIDIICELIDQLKRLLTHIEIKVICGEKK